MYKQTNMCPWAENSNGHSETRSNSKNSPAQSLIPENMKERMSGALETRDEDSVQPWSSSYLNSIFASSAVDSFQLFSDNEFVVHATNEKSYIEELASGKIKLASHPDNLYGPRAFYVTKHGISDDGSVALLYEMDRSILKSIEMRRCNYAC